MDDDDQRQAAALLLLLDTDSSEDEDQPRKKRRAWVGELCSHRNTEGMFNVISSIDAHPSICDQ